MEHVAARSDAAEVPAASTPGTRRRRRPWVIRAVVILIVLYVLYLTAMYFLQDLLIFPGTTLPRQAADGPTVAGVEQVWLAAPDGERIEAWFMPGRGRTAASPGPAVIFFHGNYDLVDQGWAIRQNYHPLGISVLAIEYRGYGRVGGWPSQTNVVADGLMFREWLAARPEVDASRIIYEGQSLGGAVAAALAAEQPPAALILNCTFTSIPAMSGRYLVPGFLARNPFRTDRIVERLDVPILIMHGRRDITIPVSHGRRLHELAPHSRYVELDCGHPDFRVDERALREFLQENGLLP